ncbi:MAG: hypothetical protein M1828_000644 [Chrysothrix sp. TS-e1954]|nr:MAG: hypothetical protein M1828_000644 [Chrysothrix sp. TS-e1954]
MQRVVAQCSHPLAPVFVSSTTRIVPLSSLVRSSSSLSHTTKVEDCVEKTPSSEDVHDSDEASAKKEDVQTPAQTSKPKKTLQEIDNELKAKMAGLAGDGGEAGVELEDGQPTSMKRSVKNNMFRYI